MKTLNKKILILSLGLLASVEFASHASQAKITKKTILNNIRQELQKVKANPPGATIVQSTVNPAMEFIKKAANTVPSSPTLNAAFKATEAWVENYQNPLFGANPKYTEEEKSALQNTLTALDEAFKGIKKTIYYNSKKEDAAEVFAELKKLLEAITTKINEDYDMRKSEQNSTKPQTLPAGPPPTAGKPGGPPNSPPPTSNFLVGADGLPLTPPPTNLTPHQKAVLEARKTNEKLIEKEYKQKLAKPLPLTPPPARSREQIAVDNARKTNEELMKKEQQQNLAKQAQQEKMMVSE